MVDRHWRISSGIGKLIYVQLHNCNISIDLIEVFEMFEGFHGIKCMNLIRFSQTWLRYVWLCYGKSVWLTVCRLWRACTLLRGFNFSGIFLHHIVAWPSGNSPTTNHELDRPRGSPPTGALNASGVGKSCNFRPISRYPIACKRLRSGMVWYSRV